MESAVTLMAIVVMILSLTNGGDCRRCYQCADQQITGLGTFTPGGLPTCSGDSFGQQVECPVSPIPGFDLSCTITKHNYRSVLNGVEINSTLFSRDCGPGPSDDGCYHSTSDLSDPSLEELAEVGYSVLESNITICFCNQDLCNGDFDFENAPDITNPTIPPGLNGGPFGGGMGGAAGSTMVTTTADATNPTISPGLNGGPFGGGMGGDVGSTKVTTTGSATAQTGTIGVLLVSALTYVLL